MLATASFLCYYTFYSRAPYKGYTIATRNTPSAALAEQGQQVEHEQSMRLNLGGDPVYSHIATLATASALADIEWFTRPHRRKAPTLAARVFESGKGWENFPRRGWKWYGNSIDTGAGVQLQGRLDFDTYPFNENNKNRVLTPSVDTVLQRNSSKYLKSSTVSLERSSTVYGAPTLRVGIVAVHNTAASLNNPYIEPINETANPDDFGEVIGLVASAAIYDRPQGRTLISTRGATKVTTDVTQHFAFHEALGTPSHTLERAKQNFGVITEFMGLPYSLPEA